MAGGHLRRGARGFDSRRARTAVRGADPAARGPRGQERLRVPFRVRPELDRSRDGPGPAPRRVPRVARPVVALLRRDLVGRSDEPHPHGRRADPGRLRVPTRRLRAGLPDDAPRPALRVLAALPAGARGPPRDAAARRPDHRQLSPAAEGDPGGAAAHRRDGRDPRGDRPWPPAHPDLRDGGLRGGAFPPGQPTLLRRDPRVGPPAGAEPAAHGDPRGDRARPRLRLRGGADPRGPHDRGRAAVVPERDPHALQAAQGRRAHQHRGPGRPRVRRPALRGDRRRERHRRAARRARPRAPARRDPLRGRDVRLRRGAGPDGHRPDDPARRDRRDRGPVGRRERRRSSICSLGSTTREPAASPSTASTCATRRSGRCAGRSAS